MAFNWKDSGFADVADVERKFGEPGVLNGAEVVYASYDGAEALVVFRCGGELWLCEASHCSCYDLEGQWRSERVVPEVVRTMTRNYPGLAAALDAAGVP